MSSPLRPRRPQASQPSPATDMDLSSDDSTLVGDEYLYSHAELGLELCGPDSSVIVEATPSTTIMELGATWQHLNKAEYDLRTPFGAVAPESTLANIIMTRRVDFEPWDASSDIVLSVAPANHPSPSALSTGRTSANGKIRIVIRNVDGKSVRCTVTGRARLLRIAEGYAMQVSASEDNATYR
ncbi:hypothetical protein A1Q2_06663 [Trichosporon asahii var. asahii CBS 8904]|uniref:Uncharacterized protein n=1 Tax=Trichosporon asahii var. asahii (strain CBS 8904) TaxID=1220162 RepID=K1V4J0_TRIAC|nr:hypothetical protein A1Q2_06663 [Trichosporon asahii var. asahii CBS 8904]